MYIANIRLKMIFGGKPSCFFSKMSMGGEGGWPPEVPTPNSDSGDQGTMPGGGGGRCVWEAKGDK